MIHSAIYRSLLTVNRPFMASPRLGAVPLHHRIEADPQAPEQGAIPLGPGIPKIAGA